MKALLIGHSVPRNTTTTAFLSLTLSRDHGLPAVSLSVKPAIFWPTFTAGGASARAPRSGSAGRRPRKTRIRRQAESRRDMRNLITGTRGRGGASVNTTSNPGGFPLLHEPPGSPHRGSAVGGREVCGKGWRHALHAGHFAAAGGG